VCGHSVSTKTCSIDIFGWQLCLKLCHLKAKDVIQFTLLVEKGGQEIKERKKGGEDDSVVLIYNSTSVKCRISQNFMESKGLLLCSQELTIVLCPDPDKSSVHPPIWYFKIHFNIISYLCLGLPSGLFP
jgi:hypothetical protein